MLEIGPKSIPTQIATAPHQLTKVNHPWTNGQVERINRTIKEATVKRYYYQSHDHLKRHLHTFLMAYNFAKRLKTLKGPTPYEYICKIWTNEPDRFKVNPLQHNMGLNISTATVNQWIFNSLLVRCVVSALLL